jgi:hypothetical protein
MSPTAGLDTVEMRKVSTPAESKTSILSHLASNLVTKLTELSQQQLVVVQNLQGRQLAHENWNSKNMAHKLGPAVALQLSVSNMTVHYTTSPFIFQDVFPPVQKTFLMLTLSRAPKNPVTSA